MFVGDDMQTATVKPVYLPTDNRCRVLRVDTHAPGFMKREVIDCGSRWSFQICESDSKLKTGVKVIKRNCYYTIDKSCMFNIFEVGDVYL